jgi:RimJ/RimL family protein N-acetyltransferase
MRFPFLVGPNVYLRPVEVADAAAFVTWFNDQEVARFLLRHRAISLEEEEEFIRGLAGNQNEVVLAIVERAGDRHIGGCGLHAVDQRNRHAAMGIVIGAKDCWGKGYGTEATRLLVGHCFATLNLERVWLEVYEYNPRAVRAYEKVGFRVEGRLRRHTFRDGRYWDTLVMGLLREEWQASEASPGA